MQVTAANVSASKQQSHHGGWTAHNILGSHEDAAHRGEQANIPEPRDACKVTALVTFAASGCGVTSESLCWLQSTKHHTLGRACHGAQPLHHSILPALAQDLGEYTSGLLQHVEHDLTAARAAQRHTTAADLSITPLDAMEDVESIPARISFINSLSSQVSPV